MLLLFETASGYAIFRVLDEQKLQETENLYKDFETLEKASNVVQLVKFHKFADTTEGLTAVANLVEGQLNKPLRKMLKKLFTKEPQEMLAVADAKLGGMIKEKLSIKCLHSMPVLELTRCVRSQMSGLLPERESTAMALGLAHSLSRYKLKFNPEKVDTMIQHSIGLLDEADKEINNYVMRLKEFYGWHFPELSSIVTENMAYVKTVKAMGMRSKASECDLSEVLPEDLEERVKAAAVLSMGTEISDMDLLNIFLLCDRYMNLCMYRARLYDYLRSRMAAIAPNVTSLVGELVGARLIAKAGSLLTLAKYPASTVQILGAEKALFRALKTKHDTPKYGLIYHASLIGQSQAKLKGKMSRVLANKVALACRVDAIAEEQVANIGPIWKAKLEARLKCLEEQGPRRISGLSKQQAKFDKYENRSEVKVYDSSADFTLTRAGLKRAAPSQSPAPAAATADTPLQQPASKKQKKQDMKVESEDTAPVTPVQVKSEDSGATDGIDEGIKKKKKRKHKVLEESTEQIEMTTPQAGEDSSMIADGVDEGSKKKKKKKPNLAEESTTGQIETTPQVEASPKKKKKKVESADVDVSTLHEGTLTQTGETTMENVKKKKKKKKKSDDV